MNDGIDAREVLERSVADVQRRRGHGGRLRAEGAGREEARVEARDGVSGGAEDRREDGADVAVVAGEEDAHREDR